MAPRVEQARSTAPATAVHLKRPEEGATLTSTLPESSAKTEQGRPEWPEELTRVPYWVFQRQDVYREEQQNLFRGPYWSYLCLEAEVPQPGDYRTTFVGDTPVIVCRDEDGELVFDVESWARPADLASSLLHHRLRMAKEVQLHMWTTVCERVAKLARGRLAGGLEIKTRVVAWDRDGGS